MKTYNRKRKLEVGHLSGTWFTFAPGVIAAAGNLEYLTHQLDGIPAAMVMDKLKSQLLVRAMPVLSTAEVMMAVAFLRFHSPAALPKFFAQPDQFGITVFHLAPTGERLLWIVGQFLTPAEQAALANA